MSSDSDDVSVSSAVKTRRYRQRKRAGIVSRPMASAEEQHRLLSLPFETLTPQQKARVRYYRRRDRSHPYQQPSSNHHLDLSQPSPLLQSNSSDDHAQQQAQLVASRFPLTSVHQPVETGLTSVVSSSSLSLSLQDSPHPSLLTTAIPLQQYSETSISPAPQPSHPISIPVAMVPTSLLPSFLFQMSTMTSSPSSLVMPTSSMHYPALTYHANSLTLPQHPLISLTPPSDAPHPNIVSEIPSSLSTPSSETSSRVSSTPVNILVDMTRHHTTLSDTIPHLQPIASATSTSTSIVTPDGNTIASTPTSTSISSITNTSLDDLFTTSPYLVNAYDSLPEHKSSYVSTASPSIVSIDQWKSQHDYIYNLLLIPQQRHQHMTQVVTGKYISVTDMDIKQDIHPNPHRNIIQELISTSTSSSSVSAAQQLKYMFPLSMSTHSHPAYNQQVTMEFQSPPTFKLTTIKQNEVYDHLIHASTTSVIPPDKNIFIPSINIKCIQDERVRQRLIDTARAAQHQYKQYTTRKHQEIECDDVFSSPLDGFGISGLQVYIKSGDCITWLHDELLWCSALNYMLKESQGCALWIAVGLHDLKQHLPLDQVEQLLLSNKNKHNIMEVGILLDTLLKSNVNIEYVFQYPGQLVASPPGNGSAHFVFSYGTLMTQIAWDYSFTIPGAVQCLSYWGINDEHDHYAIGNTSMSSISVLPLFTMQLQGYQLGLMDQIQQLQQYIVKLRSIKPKTRVKHDSSVAHIYCHKCFYRQDWLRINNQCVHCYFRNPKILALLQ